DIEPVLYAVTQDGLCSEIGHYFRAGGKGVRGYQHFIAWFQADSVQRQLQRTSSGGHGQCVVTPKVFGKGLVESVSYRPGGQTAGSQHVVYSFDLFFAD